MDSYFIRHTKTMLVEDSDLDEVWNQDKIAIHFSGDGEEDSKSLDPDDYRKPSERQAIRCFKSLADNGGYVWVEHRSQINVKVGKVMLQEPEFFSATWTQSSDSKYADRVGKEAVLKTLQLQPESVKLVRPHEAMSLRAARRRQGTISRWWACKGRLASLVDGKPVEHSWDNLPPDLQETACAEFLRFHNADYPQLSFLLMPVGRTLKDVDIYGLDSDGNEIFAQVTFFEKDSPQSQEKIQRLKEHKGAGNKLLYFCRTGKTGKFVDKSDILFIPAEDVEEWSRKTIATAKSYSLFDTVSA